MQHLDVAEKLEENRELTVEFYLTALELADLSERFGTFCTLTRNCTLQT